MAEIPRKTAKLFGSNLTPSGNVAAWGSTATGTPVYSNDPDVLQSSAWINGFNGAIIGNRSPVMEEFNGNLLVAFQQIAYLLQSGVAQWDASTTYWPNNYARVGKVLYVSQTNNNVGNDPTTDTNNWQPFFNLATGPTVCAASVVFDGLNDSPSGYSRIISAFNVTNITHNGTGSYTVNFTNAFPSANYVLAGTCGSEDGQAYGSGDDGVIVGNLSGQGNAIRSASSCRLFTINPTNKALVQSGCVSVNFFALP
jgi:hypothetical protein